jgi:hypothetical protein
MEIPNGTFTANPDYEWVAEYEDGTALKEGFGTDHEKNYGDIDLSKLVILSLVDKCSGKPKCSVNIRNGSFSLDGMEIKFRMPEGQRQLINFKRTRQDFTPSGVKSWSQNHIGYQVTVDGVNHQAIIAVERDGSFTIVPKK